VDLNVWPVGGILRLATWAALVIACAASLALRQADTRYQFGLMPKDIAHNEGAAFQAPLSGQVSWPWQRAPDTMSNQRQSGLILFENGHPLGPPHQAHAEIRNLGNGRFSHWSNYILFSASDNSDPRTNGRYYYAVDHARLSPLVAVLPWLLLLAWATASGGKVWRSRLVRRLSSTYRALERRIGAIAIYLVITTPIIIIANIIIIRHWSVPAAMTPDTQLYTRFNEIRTVGYPVFLKTVIVLFGDLRLLVAIQLNLLLGSILILGWAVTRLVGNLLCGIVVVVVLSLNPALLTWAEQLMSEGLFIPLLLAHAAFVLLILTRFSRAAAAFAGMSLIAAILVRPAAYSLLLNLPLLILLLRGRRIAILTWTIIPAAALYVAAAGLHKAALGTWQSQSFGGYTLLGKVALLIHGDVPEAPPVGAEIYRRIAVQVRDAETKRFPTEFWMYTASVYDPILYEQVSPVLSDYVKRTDANSSDPHGTAWSRMNSVAWALAVRVIEHDPIGYLRLVLAQYYGLWSITLIGTPLPPGESYLDAIEGSLKLLAENSDLRSWAHQVGLGDETFYTARETYLKKLASYRRLDTFIQTTIPAFRLGLLITAACVVFLCCPYWLWQLAAGRPIVVSSAALLYLSVALNGYYILVASVEFALPRYVEAFEGIILTIDFIAFSAAVAYFWLIFPTVSTAFQSIFLPRRSAEIASGNVSPAKIARR